MEPENDSVVEDPIKVEKWVTKLPGCAKLLTLAEVCDWLQMSPQVVKKLCRNRQIPCMKIGKFWRFSREELTTWLKNQK
jgi:excisionase family DNA binding protein